MRGRARWWILAMGVVLVALVRPAARLWKAECILQRLSQQTESNVTVEDTLVPMHRGMGLTPAHVYYRRGVDRKGPGVVVVHGVHHLGIDEPRLVAFSRALADSGMVVLTPQLSDLADYRITRDGAETIADSVRWFSQSDWVENDRVGLLGFSFAGGLSLLAAGESDIRRHLSWVASVGGHHDLSRVLRFFVEDRVQTPHGPSPKKAHEYGLAVLVYGQLDRLVPEQDREIASDALRAWLHEDRATARSIAELLTTPEAQGLFARVESHRLRELGPELESIIDARADELARLSPRGKFARIRCPIFLLHGADDSVIPASETDWADLELGAREHRALVSPILEHVEMNHDASLLDVYELVDFISRLVG